MIKSNKGSSGVDKESIEEFEKNLKKNLYKIWNRMSSGSYFPSPVKVVEIPKKSGGKRSLGIPTISDRIAQMVCKIYLEPDLERIFHRDSYGYRAFKSAHQAIKTCRERCWRNDWVIDMDIKGFFDNIDHELMMKLIRFHTDKEWIILYVERWLKAEAQMPDGIKVKRIKGTPQGGVISPLLANLFLHYTFDKWINENYPHILFERYADDCIVHCKTLKQAEYLKRKMAERFKKCKLELNEAKTKIVYCKDKNRCEEYENMEFDFLGYTFRRRGSKDKYGRIFINFLPAISKKSSNDIKDKIRKWEMRRWTSNTIEGIAKEINIIVKGWINYYGKFYKSEMRNIFQVLNRRLMKWAMGKYKRLRRNWNKAEKWLKSISQRNKLLFAHWAFGVMP